MGLAPGERVRFQRNQRRQHLQPGLQRLIGVEVEDVGLHTVAGHPRVLAGCGCEAVRAEAHAGDRSSVEMIGQSMRVDARRAGDLERQRRAVPFG